jgi:hypothetical protein
LLCLTFIVAGGCVCDIDHLTKNLIHIFDRGFADVDDQWPADELLDYLYYIRYLLTSLPALRPQSFSLNAFTDDFTQPMSLFIRAKESFLLMAPRCDWKEDPKGFRWMNERNQRKHIDLLTHSKSGESWTIHVVCTAKLGMINGIKHMKLFVGSIVNGVNIDLFIYNYPVKDSMDESEEIKIIHFFKQELRTLINFCHEKNLYTIEDENNM